MSPGAEHCHDHGGIPETDLGLNRWGLRFTQPATENNFQCWHRDQSLPFVITGIAVALLGWMTALLGGALWMPTIIRASMHTWLPVILMIMLCLLLASWPTMRSRIWPLAGLNLMVIHFGQIRLALEIGAPVNGMGLALATAIIMVQLASLFASIMRLPAAPAALCTLPATVALVSLSLSAYRRDLIDALFVGFACWAAIIVWVAIVINNLMMEFQARKAFIQDQHIRQQNRELEKNSELVRRYVPPSVVEHIHAGDGGHIDAPQRRRVTVLFADIVGFTDMADRLDAESLTEILNQYMATMSDLVGRHQGTLNEFAGDGLMALFGAPAEMDPEEQVFQAVSAARAMQAALPALNAAWLKLGIGRALSIRIGINTGVLSVGSFGSEGRMTYTAIGLQTNVAARIQAHCEPGGILLSDASWQLVKDRVECESRGEIEVKGVHYPLAVHAVKP